MRFTPTYDADLGQTQIEWTSNCYTDALPLLRYWQIRKQEVDLTSQSLALATAVLAVDYIGDQFEFTGLRIGNDYAEAIEAVMGRRVAISNVDGLNRTIATSDVDVFAGPATEKSWTTSLPPLAGDVPLIATTWSGDFVDPETRRSTGFAFGEYQTNARLFADETLVSIAIGLVHGRDRCRTLHIPHNETDRSQFDHIRRALKIVGIHLEWTGQAAELALIPAIASPGRDTQKVA